MFTSLSLLFMVLYLFVIGLSLCCTMPCHNFALYLLPFCVLWPDPKCLGDDMMRKSSRSGRRREREGEGRERQGEARRRGHVRAISRSGQRAKYGFSQGHSWKKNPDPVRREKRPGSVPFCTFAGSRGTTRQPRNNNEAFHLRRPICREGEFSELRSRRVSRFCIFFRIASLTFQVDLSSPTRNVIPRGYDSVSPSKVVRAMPQLEYSSLWCLRMTISRWDRRVSFCRVIVDHGNFARHLTH